MNLDKLLRPRSPETMFSLFEKCAKEAESITVFRNERGELLAPPVAGKATELVSKLNDEVLLKVVQTPTFKKWFGDWQSNPERASKVVYESTGEPKVVFHSTWRDIPSKEGLAPKGSIMEGPVVLEDGSEGRERKIKNPVFFSDSASDSLSFGNMNRGVGDTEAAVMYPSFLNIRHPRPRYLGPLSNTDAFVQSSDFHGETPNMHYAVIKGKEQILSIPFNFSDSAKKAISGASKS